MGLGHMVWYSGTAAFFENVVHDVMIDTPFREIFKMFSRE